MKKTELTDTTFTMVVRFDSIMRLENALAVINFLNRNFYTKIYVLETSSHNNYFFKSLLKNRAHYFFMEDHDTVFHKTKYTNILARKVNTPFMSIWDADIIADRNQIVDAVEKLRKNEADVSYPYDGRCLDTSDVVRALYLARKNIKVLHGCIHYMQSIYGDNMVGGAVFVNTEKYMLSGMDNEDFYGWGNEDFERQYRFEALKYRIYRSKSPIYHLSHSRDINGMFRSKEQYKWTGTCLQSVKASSENEIINALNFRNLPVR
jgi:hypothetical protein